MKTQINNQQTIINNPPHVIGFGALNLDRILYVNRIVKPDEEGFISSVENHPGGSAANTIVGLSRLGIRTGYIGKVAHDEGGEILLNDLTLENVDTVGVTANNGRSGACLIMVDGKGERGILVDPGVNDTIPITDIDMKYIDSADLIHMTSFICKESEISFLTQKQVALSTSSEISLDPGTLYAERGMEGLIDFIKRARLLLPNDHELHLMTGYENVHKGANMLIDAGAEWVAVKMGDRGCYVTDGIKSTRISAVKANVVDTTGAGDAFNAGFIYSMLQGKNIEECGKIGNITASISIAHRGARAGLLYSKELKEFTKDL